MHLLVFGAPGVGKGTQAKILSGMWDIPHISTGDILRESIKKQTETGKKASAIMSRGELVPDDIMVDIIREALQGIDYQNGFLLDGFPRTVTQARSLDKLFLELGITDVSLISFEADEEELVKRLTMRKSCKKCDQIFSDTEIQGLTVCPACGAENSFFQRNDDTESVIRRRFEVFTANTQPVLEFYQSTKKILHIDALQSIEAVTAAILTGLKA
jgi:adenylate kinase